MRIPVISLLFAILLSAQNAWSQVKTKIFLNAGINITKIHAKEIDYLNEDFSNAESWVAGGQIEFINSKHILFYTGASVNSYSYRRIKGYFEEYRKSKYNPVFLNIPVGIGYNWQASDHVDFNFYGGAYLNVGIGGSLTYTHYYWAPVNQVEGKEKVSYGNSADADYRRTNWGLQPGISIGFFQMIQMTLNYQIGMSNIIPKENELRDDRKLRSLIVSLKYQLNSSWKSHIKRSNLKKY